MLLLDTNIVSYFFKQHTIWSLYFPMAIGRDLAVSFQTVAEMEEGSIVANWSVQRRRRMEAFLQQFSIFQSTPIMNSWWAYVRAYRHSQPISATDAWIAATALSYDLDLVTHNPKDFRGIPGLRVLTAAKG